MIRFNQRVANESRHCGSNVDRQDVEMGVMVRFPVERVSRTSVLRPDEDKLDGGAKILFFSGVRYSSMSDLSAGAKFQRTSKAMRNKLR